MRSIFQLVNGAHDFVAWSSVVNTENRVQLLFGELEQRFTVDFVLAKAIQMQFRMLASLRSKTTCKSQIYHFGHFLPKTRFRPFQILTQHSVSYTIGRLPAATRSSPHSSKRRRACAPCCLRSHSLADGDCTVEERIDRGAPEVACVAISKEKLNMLANFPIP